MAERHLDVWLERGRTRTFAIPSAWPGWARSARTKDGDEAAIEALLSYAPRYAVVADRAGIAFDGDTDTAVRVVGECVGTTTTDFGAPDVVLPFDAPASAATARRDLERQVALLRAAWDLFDEVSDAAPAELAKGPRGGGRDTAKVVVHVVEAERAYSRKVGVRHPPFDPADRRLRQALHDAEAAAYLADDASAQWPARYALRRTAWHVLDHVWEIQDRS